MYIALFDLERIRFHYFLLHRGFFIKVALIVRFRGSSSFCQAWFICITLKCLNCFVSPFTVQADSVIESWPLANCWAAFPPGWDSNQMPFPSSSAHQGGSSKFLTLQVKFQLNVMMKNQKLDNVTMHSWSSDFSWVQIVFADTSLTSSHFCLSAGSRWTKFKSWSESHNNHLHHISKKCLFLLPLLPQLRVTHMAPMWMNSSEDGRQIGLAKSEKITGLSILSTTIELPSTGDFTMPTILLFCSQGALLLSLIVANLATHFALSCLQEKVIKDGDHWTQLIVLPLETGWGCHDPLVLNESPVTNMLAILVQSYMPRPISMQCWRSLFHSPWSRFSFDMSWSPATL